MAEKLSMVTRTFVVFLHRSRHRFLLAQSTTEENKQVIPYT